MPKNHRKDHAPKSSFHMTSVKEKIKFEPCHGNKFLSRHSYKTGKNLNNDVLSNHERNIVGRAKHLNISVVEYKRKFCF